MSAKSYRTQGPSWTEVFLGAFLSVVLGVVLGAALLMLRPVVVAKQEPKERVAGSVYYIEGSRDLSKAPQARAKREAFLAGQSIAVTEDEINALVDSAIKAAGAKPGDTATPVAGDYVSAGVPAVRIRDGSLQVGVPLTVPMLSQRVIFQARGGFERQGEGFVFSPTTLYLGSCPLERIPGVAQYVRSKLTSAYALPEDMKAAWAKLIDVSVDGQTLKLTMP